MADKHLYIISGPNGAGKTTASYSVLPKILHCKDKDIIERRYFEGIDNLFKIYMPIVDTWLLVNNSETPRSIIASGGCNQEFVIRNSVLYKKIEEYVKR